MERIAWRGPDIAPLFYGIYQGKPIDRPLGTTKVKLIIKEAVTAAGFAPEDAQAFSGHSLRVNAAQGLMRPRSSVSAFGSRMTCLRLPDTLYRQLGLHLGACGAATTQTCKTIPCTVELPRARAHLLHCACRGGGATLF
jgi:hypothetical protein